MKSIIDKLEKKTVIARIAYLAIAIALIADIVFFAVNGQDQTFDVFCFALMIIGSIVGLLELLVDFKFNRWLTALCYAVAFGFHLHVALPSLSDWWNDVNFVGGNQEMALIFGAIFLVCTIVVIVANFCNEDKSKN